MHQCYYCEQIFDSKEDLFQHVEIHSDMERNKEIWKKLYHIKKIHQQKDNTKKKQL
jgi:uncharacterized C2H2 Zn-finger protein